MLAVAPAVGHMAPEGQSRLTLAFGQYEPCAQAAPLEMLPEGQYEPKLQAVFEIVLGQ